MKLGQKHEEINARASTTVSKVVVRIGMRRELNRPIGDLNGDQSMDKEYVHRSAIDAFQICDDRISDEAESFDMYRARY